ncbi:MAG: 4-hydroxythreonine-4-phosphate dehydrogenase PdxA [Actinomycetota bacterium]|nr:4-hydroxythreonine-4-phosphate dehydrogenase PdxA [Actinomycetota bacterium]
MAVRLALTMGDPSGIGPEICLGALEAASEVGAQAVIVGDAAVLRRAAEVIGGDHALTSAGAIDALPPEGHCVLDLHNVDAAHHEFGRVKAEYGRASVEYLKTAVGMCLGDRAGAIVTAPINKEALKAAEVPEPGHTEMLGTFTGTDVYETMFMVERMRIFFATRHLSLKGAIDAITQDGLLRTLDNVRNALKLMGLEEPEIAVAALNPHGGEGGLFGDEEIVAIRPAVEAAKNRGWRVVGPIPADSIFAQHRRGKYDAVLSLFHDQGHIASKTVDFDGTVSVTTGLPIIRTSVDHGTAFDIAGQGIADPGNMQSAVRRAVELHMSMGEALRSLREKTNNGRR